MTEQKEQKKATKGLGFKIPADLYETLKEDANRQRRPLTNHITWILEQHLGGVRPFIAEEAAELVEAPDHNEAIERAFTRIQELQDEINKLKSSDQV